MLRSYLLGFALLFSWILPLSGMKNLCTFLAGPAALVGLTTVARAINMSQSMMPNQPLTVTVEIATACGVLKNFYNFLYSPIVFSIVSYFREHNTRTLLSFCFACGALLAGLFSAKTMIGNQRDDSDSNLDEIILYPGLPRSPLAFSQRRTER